jgi:hypothetical protein
LDENNGPSEAWVGFTGGENYIKPGAVGCITGGSNGYCSESFDIIGTPNASTVPEPRSSFLFGAAIHRSAASGEENLKEAGTVAWQLRLPI